MSVTEVTSEDEWEELIGNMYPAEGPAATLAAITKAAATVRITTAPDEYEEYHSRQHGGHYSPAHRYEEDISMKPSTLRMKFQVLNDELASLRRELSQMHVIISGMNKEIVYLREELQNQAGMMDCLTKSNG